MSSQTELKSYTSQKHCNHTAQLYWVTMQSSAVLKVHCYSWVYYYRHCNCKVGDLSIEKSQNFQITSTSSSCPYLAGDTERGGDLEVLRGGDLLPLRAGVTDLDLDLEADLHFMNTTVT